MNITGGGVSVDLPVGWEASITPGARGLSFSTPLRVAHFANFPLPAHRADFGGDVVDLMRSGDAFVVLYEYESGSAERELFAAEGIPTVTVADFDRDNLQNPHPDQSGVQRFFRIGERAFCLFVVVGSHVDRVDVIPQVQAVLASLRVES